MKEYVSRVNEKTPWQSKYFLVTSLEIIFGSLSLYERVILIIILEHIYIHLLK